MTEPALNSYPAWPQWRSMIASIWWFSGSTSITAARTPRAAARSVSRRNISEPTPRFCQRSATTRPRSVVAEPSGATRSTAIAWPTIAPSSVATSTSLVGAAPHIRRSTAELGSEAGVKNRRNRARSDSAATNDLIPSQSAAAAARI